MRRDPFRQLIDHRYFRNPKFDMMLSIAPLCPKPQMNDKQSIHLKIRNQSHNAETPLRLSVITSDNKQKHMKHPVFYMLLCSHLAKKLTVPDLTQILPKVSLHTTKKRRLFCGQASCVITAYPCNQCLLACSLR